MLSAASASDYHVMMLTGVICCGFQLFLAFALADHSSFASSAFRATGYREHTQEPGQRVSIQASAAEGMSQLAAKTLYHAQIEIEKGGLTIRLTGDEALAKKNEIVVTGTSAAEVFGKSSADAKAKLAFALASGPPEHVIRFDTDTLTLQAPAASVTLSGQKYLGRGLAIDLQKNKIVWVQSVSDGGGKVLKTPLTLKAFAPPKD